ncbi:COG3014 family protein [Vibrio algicola]|uniref:Lipoprotein n=1 Tax=Vibrio algicola TaxID=2662262 RepID=A0A5Q0TJ67_9VIBR|nr:hypothetical protein [Vibrio algicola]
MALVLVATLFLSACANLSAGNLFSHYSAQNHDAYKNVMVGDYQEAAEELKESDVGGPILSNMEKGRVTFLAERYPDSFSALQLSDKAVNTLDQRATVSVSESANQAGSLATNDNLTTYEPADYELGYLHLYLGLNYLQQNDLSGALVEMRRANQVQEKAQKRREKELKEAQADMASNGVKPNMGSVLSNYPAAGNTLQAVQNAYLLYLSASLYEAGDQLNDAYIDYKRALAVYPENKQIIEATLRVAKQLGMRQDLSMLTKQYGEPKSIPKGQGQVVILDEQGIVAARDNWRLNLPLFNSRDQVKIYSVTLPYYKSIPNQHFNAIQLEGHSLTPSLLADTNVMAKNDLSERIPAMVLKQGLRLYVKDQMLHQAAKNDDSGIANIIVNIWNVATEQPDTRSWQTLPGKVYSSSINLPAGDHAVTIGAKSYTLPVKANQRMLVWVSRQGNSVTMWHKQLGEIE